MTISKETVKAAYQRYARNYDFAVKLYRLLGLHIEQYRSRVIELLQLKSGDHVVELGCGTGLNFSRIMEKIGSEGQLIGVDISDNMLAIANERVERAGWKNVQLICSDLVEYSIPDGINAVLSTGVLGYVNERNQIIEEVSRKLGSKGRIVIFDLKRSDRIPSWLFKILMLLASPFGVTEEYFDNHTWEAVEAYFKNTTYEEYYGGLVYISSGISDT